jgi:large subunit ribosomal protein L4
MEVAVKNIQGKEVNRKVELNGEIFAIEPNDHAIYLDVKSYNASQRQGTHKSKERGEITGSTRKLHKQKGTGGSRKGSIKNPLFKGGGRVFGPKPRDYSFKLNKKVKVLARKSALTYKAQDGAITIIEDFTFEAPKTRQYVEVLKALNINERKSLVVLSETDSNLALAARNLKNHKVVCASDLNTYDILKYNHLVLAEGALEVIENILNRFEK